MAGRLTSLLRRGLAAETVSSSAATRALLCPSFTNTARALGLMSGVSGNYASVLYISAVKANVLDKVESELLTLVQASKKSPTFPQFMKDQSVTADTRVKAINEIFTQAKVSDTKNFLMKHLNNSISSVGYSKFSKHINNFKKAIISSFYGSKRRYSDCPSGFRPGILSNKSHPILQSSGLQHWFKNWQHLRKHKLTASTFSLAVGFWPHGRARLWLEKIGAIEPFSGDLATCWSNIKEEEALERYKLITGNSVSYPEFQVYGKKNPEDNWLAASPDGAVNSFIYGLPTRGVLEIKCPFFGGDMSKAQPWKRLPLHYIPQAQGLMEILDRDWMDMYVWTVNGSSLFRLHRDVEYWNILKTALSDFWWKHVQPAKEICDRSVITNPLVELSSLRPAPKHELHRCIVYESKLLVDNSRLLMREIHGKLQN